MKPTVSREDEVLKRMLKMPPKPHAPLKASKAKASRVSRSKNASGATTRAKADGGEV